MARWGQEAYLDPLELLAGEEGVVFEDLLDLRVLAVSLDLQEVVECPELMDLLDPKVILVTEDLPAHLDLKENLEMLADQVHQVCKVSEVHQAGVVLWVNVALPV